MRKIRTQYTTEKEDDALQELRRLDCKVKRPAKVFAYLFGSIGAMVMGAGMSLVMTDLSKILSLPDPMVYGIVIGAFGMLMTLLNYPIYKGILGKRRKRYAEKILALSEKLMQE